MKNVKKLLNIFQLKNCLRMKFENYISTFVFQSFFSVISKVIDEFQDWIVKSSMFDSSKFLHCFHELHRLKIAKQHLFLFEKWWIVNLYVKEHLNLSNRNSFRNEFNNSKNYFDDDVYRNLRLYHQFDDVFDRKKWLSKFSDMKRRDVFQLKKKIEKCIRIKNFQQKLNNFIVYRKFWFVLQFEIFHRLLSLKCFEIKFFNRSLLRIYK